MKILETERLILREIVEADAEFILDLLNQPSFIKYIGDRGVSSLFHLPCDLLIAASTADSSPI